MGSKNCAETPRQKMISMMYLVLTAMLALNVSKDILDAFIVVNDSIVETKRIFQSKVEGNYAMFDKAFAVTPGKVKENYDKAQEVKKLSNELVGFIDGIKYEMIATAEGKTVDEIKSLEASCKESGKSFLSQISAKDNFDKPTHYMLGSTTNGESNCKAADMKNKIIEYKKKMETILGKYAKEVNFGLDVEKQYPKISGEGTMNWQMTNFYHTIVAADVVILNKIILEIRNLEADVVAQLYSAVSSDDFTFDKVGAKVVAKSSYVLTGEEYEAEIFVAAYDSKQQPEIVVGSGVDTLTNTVLGSPKVIEGKDGVGFYKVPAGAVGEQKYGGVIKVRSKSGAETVYPFESSYFVGQPSATVSADKMNVFYIGVDNPVTISVPGVPQDKIRATISSGSLSPAGGKGKYIVRVTGGAKATISVSADQGSGSKSMGQVEFRIKPLPTPKAYVANKPGGNYSSAELMASPYVTAVMENFDFDLRYNVVSYTFLAKNNAGDLIPAQGRGGAFDGNMKSQIQSSRRGTRFWVEDIIAAGPGGNKNLGSVSIRITN